MKNRKYKHIADTPETAAKAAAQVRNPDEESPAVIGGETVEEIHRQSMGFDGELSTEEPADQPATPDQPTTENA